MINPLARSWSLKHASPLSKYCKTTIVVLELSDLLENAWSVQWRNVHEMALPYMVKYNGAPVIVDVACYKTVKVKK